MKRVHARPTPFFRYRIDASVLPKATLALGFASLTGLTAQIRIPLPFSPAPITLRTFVVLLAGIVLGMRIGGLSQGLYVGIGVAGMPWFQGSALASDTSRARRAATSSDS